MATAGDGPGPGPERAFAPELPDAGPVILDGDESGHLVRSRRVREGDVVVLFDGRGETRLGTLTTANSKAAVVEVTGPSADREPASVVRLATALPEGGRADQLVSALAELGVTTLQPLAFARSPRGRDELPARRAARWERLVREAAKVSGRSRFLEIDENRAFADWAAGAGPVIVLDPDPAAAPLPEVLAATSGGPWLLVGPEGGFSREEREAIAQAGWPAARIGATALRIETAAIAGAAVAVSGA